MVAPPFVENALPVAAPREQVERVFAGHSGAHVLLLRCEGRLYLRKMASRPAQNERLHLQKEKQAFFVAAGVEAARVLASGTSGGLFFFDMTYIAGESLAARAARGLAAPGIGDFVETLIGRMRVTESGEIEPQRLRDKLRRVLAHCAANATLAPLLPRIETAVARLLPLDWPALPQSLCHGDLTFENMLVGADDRIHLIDFDVPDLSSHWLDVTKLYQDMAGLWCLRHAATEARSEFVHKAAIAALAQARAEVDAVVAALLPDLVPFVPALTALHLLRALPYCGRLENAAYALSRLEALIPDSSASARCSP